MISFRYHLVSLVAVFLALALGILVGTTVVKQGFIDRVTSEANQALKTSGELRKTVNDQAAELSAWAQFGRVIEPLLVKGQLQGNEVVLVTVEGVDVGEVEDVRKALEDAGAAVVAVLVVTPRMALADQSSKADLAGLLGDPGDAGSSETLSQRAATELGLRLADGFSGTGDLLQELIADRFVGLRGGTEKSLSDIGGSAQSVVVLSGGSAPLPVEPKLFLQPLVGSLAAASRPVVAAETLRTIYPFAPLVRSDGSLDARVVTVDNADTLPGQVAVVLGLRNLLLSPGSGGDYGQKDGASGLLPNPSP